MKRREFIALLGGAAAVWPAVARTQPAVRRIGALITTEESDLSGQANVAAFRKGLQDLGWVEGRNIQIDYRWGAGNPDRVQAYVAEIVALSPDVILAHGTPALSALRHATQKIPIVFVVVVDPVGAGFVESLDRPGGNITGFSTFEPEIGGKWLTLLHEISPRLRRVAGVLDPAFKGFAAVWRAIEQRAPKLGIQTTGLAFHDPAEDIEAVIAAFAHDSDGGLIVLPTPTNNIARERIFASAVVHRLPAVYPFRFFATDGGLMSYGFDTPDLFFRSASYIDRILRGEKPANLPVQAPTKFELVVNLKAAKAIGLMIPESFLSLADEVIE